MNKKYITPKEYAKLVKSGKDVSMFRAEYKKFKTIKYQTYVYASYCPECGYNKGEEGIREHSYKEPVGKPYRYTNMAVEIAELKGELNRIWKGTFKKS